MTEPDARFEKLLKAMSQGEAPKVKATKGRGQESTTADKQAAQR